MLVGSDLGVGTVTSLISDVRADLESGKEVGESELTTRIKDKVCSVLLAGAPIDAEIAPVRRDNGDPLVVMVVGVNGVGKTTTVAKIASQWKGKGASVMMVAADTFRAAAVEQISEWGQKLDVPVAKGEPNSKPGAVVFDAMERAKKEGIDAVIIDTAGRLHTKSNLMQELEGLKNIVKKHQPDAPHETILVVDGTTGQNAISQARQFNEAVELSGLVVTKLDGTPKGGVVVAIKDELGIPVRYIGVGESEEDLRPFIPREFVEAIFSDNGGSSQQGSSINAEKRKRRRRRAEGVEA